jgi:hypothetical protein
MTLSEQCESDAAPDIRTLRGRQNVNRSLIDHFDTLHPGQHHCPEGTLAPLFVGYALHSTEHSLTRITDILFQFAHS